MCPTSGSGKVNSEMGADELPVVLLVDDESNVLSALRRVLRREAIRIESARNAREALEWIAGHSVDLVISDQRMPGMTGIELLTAIRARQPEGRRVLLSGWTSEIPKADLDAAGLFCILAKPWEATKLRSCVRRAVGIDE